MKPKKRLKRNLRILKKSKVDICSEMGLSYEIIKEKLKECSEMESNFRCAVRKLRSERSLEKESLEN